MGSDTPRVAILALNTVLFPGGLLPLRIFEPRYLEMVSECLRNEQSFGVCLIRDGQEAGPAADVHEVGTLARIRDWNALDDGLLGISTIGEQRFRLLEHEVRPSQLLVGSLQPIPVEPAREVPSAHQALVDLLRQLMQHLDLRDSLPVQYDDAAWVGYRLAEFLPLPLVKKQYLLELEDAVYRLEQLQQFVSCLAE